MIHAENAYVCLFITLFYMLVLFISFIGNLSPMAKPSRKLFLSFREWRNLLAGCFCRFANCETFSQGVFTVSQKAK